MKHVLACAAALAFFAAPAVAEDRSFYVGGFVGSDSPDDETFNGANAGGQARAIVAGLKESAVYGLTLGVASKDYSFGRVRGEVETSFRKSDVENLSLNGVARTVVGGSEASLATGMINLHYDTPLFWERVRFSGGFGFGVAGLDNSINYLVANAAAIGSSPGNLQIALPTSTTTSATQFILGAELRVSQNFSFTADVRTLDLGDVKTERYIQNAIINGVATTSGVLDSILDTEYKTTSVTVGARFSF